MPQTADDMGAVAVRTWCSLALEALGREREAIDAINVYPVADGDTGTNLYLTVESAAQAVEAVFAAHETGGTAPATADAVRAMAHGALIGARGNSGTILAQLLRGMAGVLAAGHDADRLREALAVAAAAARQAVAHPVEGTVLTVATAAAEAAARAEDGAGTATVARAAYDGARIALDATPGQLAVLGRAGVVDAAWTRAGDRARGARRSGLRTGARTPPGRGARPSGAGRLRGGRGGGRTGLRGHLPAGGHGRRGGPAADPARRARRLARGGGRRRAVERPCARGRRGRGRGGRGRGGAAVPDPDHPLRRGPGAPAHRARAARGRRGGPRRRAPRPVQGGRGHDCPGPARGTARQRRTGRRDPPGARPRGGPAAQRRGAAPHRRGRRRTGPRPGRPGRPDPDQGRRPGHRGPGRPRTRPQLRRGRGGDDRRHAAPPATRNSPSPNGSPGPWRASARPATSWA